MLFLALGLLFAGYTMGLYGWILIMGYNIGFTQLFIGPWPPNPGKGSPQPPTLVTPQSQIPGSPTPPGTVHPAPNTPGF